MSTELPDQDRSQSLEELGESPLDVLGVGGGILGAGVARDAAMRQLRVGLVEQHDLAFGTSSRSSRLLHGGLRYLAQGRIGMVRQASREKRVLHRIAPHLAEPLPFVFPTYRGSGWPAWQLRMGVKLYDLLCGGRNLGPSRWLSRSETLEHVPQLGAEGLSGAVRYFDGLTGDARLVIDTLRSAAGHGAIVSNYTRLVEASPCEAGWQCGLHDSVADRTAEVTARAVVHATGPWAEKLPQSSVRLRLTKGVHLVFDRDRLPVPDAVVMTEGKRILFAIPWGRRVIVGTTDTDYEGVIEDCRTEPEDVEYILEAVNEAFPSAALSDADVLSHWAGLRPLVADKRGRPSDVSRAHQVRTAQPGWIDVAGGKLTTYRLIAEEVVDHLLKHLRQKAPPCRTAEEPLLAPDAVEGTTGLIPQDPSAELVRYYCRKEWAVHLDDVMLRRTGWHYYRDDAAALAEQAAGWMAETFDWEATHRAGELERYHQAVS